MVRKSLIAVLAIAAGCSGGGKLVDGRKVSPDDASLSGSSESSVSAVREPSAAVKDPEATVDLKIEFKKGRKETYTLTNQSVTQTHGHENGPLLTTNSFLNAQQTVSVLNSGLVRIHTTNVSAGVTGEDTAEQAADAVMRRIAQSIEGSMLQGAFNATGTGTDMMLLGDGVGLNPMGPQAGSQDVMVGFMGILYPAKPAKVGTKWKGTYDITASAMDLFESSGGMVEKGEIPITYELLDFNEAANSVTLKISSAGKPIVKIPMGGGLAKINMDVKAEGQALVHLNDGWLQELRIETTVVTEGYVATKIVTKTVTQRRKK